MGRKSSMNKPRPHFSIKVLYKGIFGLFSSVFARLALAELWLIESAVEGKVVRLILFFFWVLGFLV